MIDQRGLKTIGWMFGAATAAVFLVAAMLASHPPASRQAMADGGYGATVAAAPFNHP